MRFTFILALTFVFSQSYLQAQSTFSDVYTILQANCSNANCHGGANPQANLDFSGSLNDVYQELVDVVPQNSTAAAEGDKLVDPGYPSRSFLLTKLAHSGWDDYYELLPSEGDVMPIGGTLPPEDIELIRQWIYFGAKQNTVDIDPVVISDFYNGMGKKKLTAPAAPLPSEGFQIRLGSLILGPQQEIEIDKKHSLSLPENVEVTKIELTFNEESHHFILYGILNPNQISEGIRIFDGTDFGNLDSEIIAAWQDPNTIELPATTAYFWEKDIVLDLNYHLINYDPDSVLAADVYINVYTQQSGIATHEMFSFLVPVDALSSFGGFGQSLVIPNDGQVHTFTDDIYNPFAGVFLDPVWHIWMLSSHTHARGVDYDIYFRNPNGTKGEQLFEGFYNFDYTFDQGFYDWEHPPIRYFEPPFPVIDITQNGLIQEASYVNPTSNPDTLYWGFTTADEMMLIFVQYTKDAVMATGIDEENIERPNFVVSPNPFQDKTAFRYSLSSSSDVKLEVFNIMGESLTILVDEQQTTGHYSYEFETARGFSAGIYIVNLTVDGVTTSQRIVSVE